MMGRPINRNPAAKQENVCDLRGYVARYERERSGGVPFESDQRSVVSRTCVGISRTCVPQRGLTGMFHGMFVYLVRTKTVTGQNYSDEGSDEGFIPHQRPRKL
jgi:hypothetical protein